MTLSWVDPSNSIGKDISERFKDKEGKWHTKVVQKAPVLHCLTMIDPATCWFNIVQISDKSSMEVAGCLETVWLNRYPIPTEVIADRGREFMGERGFAHVARRLQCEEESHHDQKPTSKFYCSTLFFAIRKKDGKSA